MRNVYVATYEHRHGRDIRVFTSDAAANAWAHTIADEWWDRELGSRPAIVRPTDPAELADAYFFNVEDEFFDIEECRVED